MLVLDATPGGQGANAYCTLDEANDYMARFPVRQDSWLAASDENRTAVLIQAAGWLNFMQWNGQKATQEQALAWPRIATQDAEGFDIPSDVIPKNVRDANAEFAYWLLQSDRAADPEKGVSISSIQTQDEIFRLFPENLVFFLLKGIIQPRNSIRVLRG